MRKLLWILCLCLSSSVFAKVEVERTNGFDTEQWVNVTQNEFGFCFPKGVGNNTESCQVVGTYTPGCGLFNNCGGYNAVMQCKTSNGKTLTYHLPRTDGSNLGDTEQKVIETMQKYYNTTPVCTTHNTLHSNYCCKTWIDITILTCSFNTTEGMQFEPVCSASMRSATWLLIAGLTLTNLLL